MTSRERVKRSIEFGRPDRVPITNVDTRFVSVSSYSGADREQIENHVRDLIEHWGTPAGGIIGKDYDDYDAIGSTSERAAWATFAFKSHRYS